MFERFIEKFGVDASPLPDGYPIADVLDALGGISVDRGLYRLHTQTSATGASEMVREAFPEYANVELFGYDWLGCQFGVAKATPESVLIFDVGLGDVLRVPSDFSAFHDEEAVDRTDAAFAADRFSVWISQHPSALGADQCIGYKVPLFLGGSEDNSNLEVNDVEVYWSLMGQMRAQLRGVHPGTEVDGVERA